MLTELVDGENLSLGEAVNELIQCGTPVRAVLRRRGRVMIHHANGRVEELKLSGGEGTT